MLKRLSLERSDTFLDCRFARMNLLCVRSTVLTEPFRAQLRKEDVRATEKDRVEMHKAVRPGDIVLVSDGHAKRQK